MCICRTILYDVVSVYISYVYDVVFRGIYSYVRMYMMWFQYIYDIVCIYIDCMYMM